METIEIANAHSTHRGNNYIKVKSQGTNPVFTFIWINDVCYTLSKSTNGKNFHLKKTK